MKKMKEGFHKKVDTAKEWQGRYDEFISKAKKSYKSVAGVLDEEWYPGERQASIVQKYLTKESSVLEIGCGAGRVSSISRPIAKNFIAQI